MAIICKQHGEFLQRPSEHVQGSGCPRCRESKGERLIFEWLTCKGIRFSTQKRFESCKYKIKLPFDFYCPEYRTLIEYNGEQHYKQVKYFGNRLTEIVRRDRIKKKWARSNRYRLLIIKHADLKRIPRILHRAFGTCS